MQKGSRKQMPRMDVLKEVRNSSSDVQGQIGIALSSTHFALDLIENPSSPNLSSEVDLLGELLNSILLSLYTASESCKEIIELTRKA